MANSKDRIPHGSAYQVKAVMSDGKTLSGKELKTLRAKDYANRRAREESIYKAHLEGQTPEFIAERFNCSTIYVNRVITTVGGAIGLRNQAQLQVLALKQLGNLMVDLDAAWDFYQTKLFEIESSTETMFTIEETDTPKGPLTKKIPKAEAMRRVYNDIHDTHKKFFDAMAAVAPKHMILQANDPLSDRPTADLESEFEILTENRRKLMEAAPSGTEGIN